MSELMALLKEMDKEFGGGYEIEDGTYYVTLNREGTKRWESEEKEDAYIISWRVDGGDNSGKTFGDFLRWHSKTKDTAQLRHRLVTGLITAVTQSVPEDRHPAIQNAYVQLLQSSDEDRSLECLEDIVSSFEDVRMPIRLRTSKTGFQNVVYLEKGGPIKMEDPREIEAVSV